LAYKAGLKCGDVITKIGPLKIVDFEDYLKAMNRIDKDVETTLLIKRDQNEYKFFVTFQ
jgi:C-terminal processing protease CtpA/Prc